MQSCLLFCTALAALAALAAAQPACSAQELVGSLPEASLFSELLAALGDDATEQLLPGAGRRLAATTPTFRACPRIAAYVCGKDGKDYINDCVAANEGAEVACEGKCPCPSASAASAAAVVTQGPVDPVMGPCPRIYIPVCGHDGKTYSNVCVAGGAAKVACDGNCPCRGVTAQTAVAGAETKGVASGEMGHVTEETGRVAAAAVACPAIFMPVCGVDGQTYGNDCSAGAAGMAVACEGECPCGSSKPVCIDMVEPVCGTDGQEYTNTCYAQVEGATVQCLGLCPCTDPVAALETGSGGTLLVPTDDALLAALEAINGTAVGSDWLGEPELLRELLARHIVLTEHQRSKQPPLPSLTGTRVVTEAGQQVELFDASKQAAGFVKTVGQVFEMFEIVAVASAPRCNVTVLQIGGVLAGPKLGQ